MCNGFFGINISAETKNIQSNPANPVIVAELKTPNDFKMELKDVGKRNAVR